MVIEYETATPAELRDLAEGIAWEEPDIAEALLNLADIRDQEPLDNHPTGEAPDEDEDPSAIECGFGIYEVTEFGDLADVVEWTDNA